MLYVIAFLTLMNFSLSEVKNAIHSAAKKYNVSYNTMSKIAYLESSFNPKAKSRYSSARGLFQFIKSTEASTRELCQIKGDIYNPYTSSELGACLLRHNIKILQANLKRKPKILECYLAHFFGINDALRFIGTTPHVIAAKVFKRQARANKTVFYNEYGSARTVYEIRAYLQHRLDLAVVL